MKRHLQKWLKFCQNYFLLMSLTIIATVLLITLIVYENSTSEISFKTVVNESETPMINLADREPKNPAPVSRAIQKTTQAAQLNLPLSLISLGARDKKAPYAIIRNNKTGGERLVRLGDTILKAVITEIDEKKVRLRLGSAEQILPLIQPEPDTPEKDI